MFYDFPQKMTDDPLPLADFTAINSATSIRRTFVTAHHDGGWDDPATWNVIGGDGGLLPGPDDDVIIAHRLALTAGAGYCRDLTIGRWGEWGVDSGVSSKIVHCRNLRIDGILQSHLDAYVSGEIYKTPAGETRKRSTIYPRPIYIRETRFVSQTALDGLRDYSYNYPLYQVYFTSPGSIVRNCVLLRLARLGVTASMRIENSIIQLESGTLNASGNNILEIWESTILSTNAGFVNGITLLLSTPESTVELAGIVDVAGIVQFTGVGVIKFLDGSTFQFTPTSIVSATISANMVVEGVVAMTKGNATPGILIAAIFLTAPQGSDSDSVLVVSTDYPSTLYFRHGDQPFSVGNLDATSVMSTCVYDRDGDQEVKGTTYYNLTLGGSGAKKLMGNVTVTGTYSLEGSATLNLNGFTLTT